MALQVKTTLHFSEELSTSTPFIFFDSGSMSHSSNSKKKRRQKSLKNFFIFSDELSSSTPYIFMDDSDDSISKHSFSTKKQTSNLLLNYADSHVSTNNTSKTGGAGPLSPLSRPFSRGQKHHESTPHQFISLSNPAEEKEPSEQEQDYLEWGESLESFQVQCIDYFRSQHAIGFKEAAYVSLPLRKAAEIVTSGERESESQKLQSCASYLEKCFDDGYGNKDSCLPSITKRHTSDHGISKETESMNTRVKEQQEEIEFLRYAIRELVFQCGRKPTTNACCTPGDDQRQAPGEPTDGRLGESQKGARDDPANLGVPTSIEINPLDLVMDDITEPAFLEQSPAEEMVEPCYLTHPIGTCSQVQPFRNDYRDDLVQQSRLQVSLGSEGLKEIKPTNKDLHCTTMQLAVCKHGVTTFGCGSRTGDTTNVARRKPFTDLFKGEIERDRARGMFYELKFANLGIVMTGKYCGALQNGIPHGRGILRFNNRDVYIGEFMAGLLHGEGTLMSPRNSRLTTLRGKFDQNVFVGFVSPSEDGKRGAGAA